MAMASFGSYGTGTQTAMGLNNPTQPIGPQSKSVYELQCPSRPEPADWRLGGSAPIFVVASCSTGEYNQADSFGASLLANGQGVAWVGGTGVLPYSGNWTQPGQGGMQDVAFKVTQLLLTGNYRLGDAVWAVMHSYMAQMQQSGGGWWAQDFDLYGDPTITFYGNGGADAVGAPWPMLRNNSAGLGYTSLTGPVQPKLLWSYPATAHVLEPLKPSPVVNSANDVVAGYFNFVDLIHGGVQKAHLTLTAPVFGSPALADDGTIYALTIGGLLYAFSPTGPDGSYVSAGPSTWGPCLPPARSSGRMVPIDRSPALAERQRGIVSSSGHPLPRYGPWAAASRSAQLPLPRPDRIYRHHRRRPGSIESFLRRLWLLYLIRHCSERLFHPAPDGQ